MIGTKAHSSRETYEYIDAFQSKAHRDVFALWHDWMEAEVLSLNKNDIQLYHCRVKLSISTIIISFENKTAQRH